MLQNIAVTDWSAQGVHMKRTDHIIMDHCEFQYNGSSGGLYHNVYFLYNKYILQSDCDMSYPIKGKGNKYTSCEFVLAQRCTIKDTQTNGIQADHEQAGYLFFHKYHISGCARVALWFPCEIVDNTWGAMWRSVHESYIINSRFKNKKIDMGLLNCELTIENSSFKKGNIVVENVKQWPKDVRILW